MSVRKIAAQLGIGKSVAGEMVKAGMPSTDVEAALEWMKQHPRRPRMAPVTQERPAPHARHGRAAVRADQTVISDYTKARAGRESLREKREQMQLDEMLGRVISLSEASRAAATVFRGLRDSTKNLSTRLKDQLAAETDPFAIQQTLDVEFDAVFAGFNVEDAVRELPDEDMDEDDA